MSIMSVYMKKKNFISTMLVSKKRILSHQFWCIQKKNFRSTMSVYKKKENLMSIMSLYISKKNFTSRMSMYKKNIYNVGMYKKRILCLQCRYLKKEKFMSTISA